jgi:hypothetical protein
MVPIGKFFRLFLCGIAIVIAASAHGQAAECTLKLQATLDLKRLPEGRFLVPVTLDDHPLHLMLDTGDVNASILTQATVDALHLDSFLIRERFRDIKGRAIDHGIEAKGFILDHLQVGRVAFAVLPSDYSADPDFGGLLGPDILRLFDVDLDPAVNRLKLFSQDHCPGKVVYWTRDWVVSPMTISRLGHIFIPVELDGKSLDAMVDTGAFETILFMPAAKRLFGLDADSPGVVKLGGESKQPNAIQRLRYDFQTLSLSGILVKHPDIVLMPDKVASALSKPSTGSMLPPPVLDRDINRSPDLIIGTNILDSLHIYIAYGEEKFYASAAGAH